MNKQTLIDVICAQTDYSPERAAEKLEEHGNNVVKVVREYIAGTNVAPVNEPKSRTQIRYNEIRNLMDTAANNFRKEKEREEMYAKLRAEYDRRMAQSAQNDESMESVD
jgi:hypothetical protein